MMNRTHWILLPLIFLVALPAGAQILGQPPIQACKPGAFTVIGYPDEFGPKERPSFDVFIDERFTGNFLTRDRSWIGDIRGAVEKWNGISQSTWSFGIAGITDEDPSPLDNRLTIAACGFEFGCPNERPPAPPGGPGGGVIDFRASTLAVTLISQEQSLNKSIKDSDIFFNPAIPFNTNPTSGEIDFETVLLHELGHALGLDHNDNCTVGRTVMESVVDLRELRQDLSSSELEGVRFLYPDGSQPSIRVHEREQSLHFDAAEGGFAPFGQHVQIYGHQGRRFSAEASESWLRVEPSSGMFDSQQEIDVLVDQSGLPVGEYTGTVTISADDMPGDPAVVEVTLNVVRTITQADFPQLTSAGAVNAANMHNRLFAPGSMVTLFGDKFSTETEAASGFPLPTTLAGVRVIINGAPASLLFVSPTQINVIIDNDEHLGRGGVIVQNGLGQNRSVPIEILEAAPQLFIFNTGDVIAINENGELNGADNPAAPGSVVTFFITGVGPVSHPVATGQPAPLAQLSTSTLDSWATIGGVPAEIGFVGLAPGFAGLGQVNITIPEGVSGRAEIILKVGNGETNSNVTIE